MRVVGSSSSSPPSRPSGDAGVGCRSVSDGVSSTSPIHAQARPRPAPSTRSVVPAPQADNRGFNPTARDDPADPLDDPPGRLVQLPEPPISTTLPSLEGRSGSESSVASSWAVTILHTPV